MATESEADRKKREAAERAEKPADQAAVRVIPKNEEKSVPPIPDAEISAEDLLRQVSRNRPVAPPQPVSLLDDPDLEDLKFRVLHTALGEFGQGAIVSLRDLKADTPSKLRRLFDLEAIEEYHEEKSRPSILEEFEEGS